MHQKTQFTKERQKKKPRLFQSCYMYPSSVTLISVLLNPRTILNHAISVKLSVSYFASLFRTMLQHGTHVSMCILHAHEPLITHARSKFKNQTNEYGNVTRSWVMYPCPEKCTFKTLKNFYEGCQV